MLEAITGDFSQEVIRKRLLYWRCSKLRVGRSSLEFWEGSCCMSPSVIGFCGLCSYGASCFYFSGAGRH